jgi:hypothetical protein
MADHPTPGYPLVIQFVGALLQHTEACATVEAHQQALQGFVDDLALWLTPTDRLALARQPFTLVDHLAFTPAGTAGQGTIAIRLSPAGRVVFRAWLRQRGLDPLVCSS